MPDIIGQPASSSTGPSASWANLKRRADIVRQVRSFFDSEGFLEVETPLLSADVVIDRHLDPLSAILPTDARTPEVGRRLWLQTSPEAAMKRLMAAGGTAIYQLTRAFRGGESGPLHNPEFSILEWYMRGESMQDGIRRLSRLCDAILGLGACETLAYADAMRTFAGVDALDSPVAVLVDAARRHRIAAPRGLSDDDRDGWLDLLMAMCVEPHLGQDRPAIVVYYPASQAALARICPDNPLVAERFELFVRGVELANGYHELADADELRRRFEHANMLRTADGKPALPHPEHLLAAIETGLPDCTGVALGLDRLVMLAVGAQALDEVIAMPIDRA